MSSMASLCKNRKLLFPKSIFCNPFSTAEPPFPSFRAAKSAIISESNPEKLAEILEQNAQFPTFLRHRPIYYLSIRKLVRAERLDLVDRVLETHKRSISDSPILKSEGFWIRLMMLYSSAGKVDQAMRTLDDMLSSKCCEISDKSLCAILTVYLNNGMVDKVHELFESMPQKLGVSPGIAAYNMVLKAFVRESNIESARKWLEKTEKEAKVAPKIFSYNILLDAYLKNRDISGFDAIVKEISNKELEYNLTTYIYRILRLCKNKECVRAKKLLDEMISKDMNPNSTCYNAIIDGFCRVGDFESARKVLASMLADGYAKPCSFTYYTLIRNLVKEGEFESALEMYKEIMKRRWIPPFEAMQGLVNGLVKMSRVEEAKEVVQKMRKRLKGAAVESWREVEASLPL